MALYVLSAMLTACASQAPISEQQPARTAVDQRMFLPEGVNQYQLQDTQLFVYPQPHDNPSPGFPADFPNVDLPPTSVCVSFAVAVDGSVQQVVPAQAPDCAPAAEVPALLRAAMQTVSQWSFDSAMLCSYPDLESKQRDRNNTGCNGDGVSIEKIPVTLSYAFVFASQQGKTTVRMRKQ
ncbi:hypothetical protein ABB29_07470 [Pseudoxanthomonas dokdonensis]|uniref:Lipoprotein n=1 Tax=Pseudoxanthomonas dokdonensis TaxID=344882 RepID=A0A0R0CVQ6_9GAMM|nr:hypothetical protein ABB29_07470 [Pseudoxanthomonas dokdonensis]